MSFGIRINDSQGNVRITDTTRLMRVVAQATLTIPSGSGRYTINVGSIPSVNWYGYLSKVDTLSDGRLWYSYYPAHKVNSTQVAVPLGSAPYVATLFIIGY